MNTDSNIESKKIIFFGTSLFSIVVLEELKKHKLLPALIVTTPSEKAGRKMTVQDPPVKSWALANGLKVIQPPHFDDDTKNLIANLRADVAVVASYGKIIPVSVLNAPHLGSWNIHPSLLPKYRGPSPIQTQILNDEKNVGVTIIQMDEQIDHGAIIAQAKLENYTPGTMPFEELGEILFEKGVELLVRRLSVSEKTIIESTPQGDKDATFTHKFDSKSGEINLSHPKESWLKYLALHKSPGVFFYFGSDSNKKRIKVTKAKFENDLFAPIMVIPEARKEMKYEDFLRGFK